MKIGFALILLILLGACSLSATQEQKLNYQTSLYVEALKDKSVVSTVAYTHPSYVNYVKSKGNDFFKKTFSFDTYEDKIEFGDRSLDKIESEGEQIQALFSVQRLCMSYDKSKEEIIRFVALTEDAGQHWFFLDYSIYVDKKICKDIKRLLN